MKLINIVVLLLAITVVTSGQKPEDILATATGHTFKLADIPADVQQQVTNLPSRIRTVRSETLEHMINDAVLSAEARVRGTTTDKLITAETAKVPAPTEAEIKAVYDANRNAFGVQTLDQVRKQIVSYLRRDPEQKRL